ncbi:carotenoid oxygenase family protein [Methylobacter sp. BlB1]|uniref:carotenoid oxygenase family protein n=1 Tax=Methylobacter sp. BlB1 TaxID=2785914 RepID=UPI001894C97C|nr:carotenoid oxygenase family protein [Methylobacter sp. BlB1]MBF6650311.1 carotenoid oxygenase family protein [Methylobacter sp. BlB1]
MNHSPYRLGFTTLGTETRIDDLPVQGAVPTWLQGTLFRNGPAKFEVDGQRYNHWFDGLAMLHRFAFSDGRVSYANRFLHSRAYREAMALGRISRREFATNPVRTPLQRVADLFFSKFTDNCSVNISKFGDELVALTETPRPFRFDPETLETLGAYDYQDGLTGHVSTAHLHFDFQRMRHYGYLLEFGLQSRYHLYSMAADAGRRVRVATLPVRKPAYMHSFGMTERYLVLTEFPLVVNPLKLRFSGKSFIRNYDWEPERGIHFHVIDKETGRLMTSARSMPYFGFHHVNAFEEDGEVVVDIVTYPDAGVIDLLYLDRLRSDQPLTALGKLTRFRVGLNGGENVAIETLSETPMDFPRFDYRNRAGHPYRYVYGVGSEIPGNFNDKLVKLDLEGRQHASWHRNGCYPGEPVFVSAPDALKEDDGIILSVVLDARKETSFLLILTASGYEELARVEAPHAIPFGFHGNYLKEGNGPLSFRTLHS